MKKYWIMFVLTLLLCLAPSCVYAGSLGGTETVDFCVTSGLDMEKEVVSTFDTSKTIFGTAQQGVCLDITVNTKNAIGNWKQNAAYSVEVGSSGLFTQAIPLKVGENQISLTASQDGKTSVTDVIVVKRKPMEIKKELEKILFIPGGTRASLF